MSEQKLVNSPRKIDFFFSKTHPAGPQVVPYGRTNGQTKYETNNNLLHVTNAPNKMVINYVHRMNTLLSAHSLAIISPLVMFTTLQFR
jgi:hypothetical protein